MDQLDAVVRAVCRLPVDFSLGGVSSVDLVERSGYIARQADVTVPRLAACLEVHPDWVSAWFGWSADNRSSPAWWVGGIGGDRYQVGYSDIRGQAETPPIEVLGKAQACAEYVKRELEQIAEIAQRPTYDEQRLWRALRRRETTPGRPPSSSDIHQP